MQISVETLKGLERKLTVSVPSQRIDDEVESRIRQLAREVKVDGFRPGKVPISVVQSRFSGKVLQEVLQELMRSTLYSALEEKKLIPAGSPYLEPKAVEDGKDFTYTAVFEVFPEIKITELDNKEIEILKAEVTDADVDDMINKLLEQNKEWHKVDRKPALGDQILFDFEGFIDGNPFEGGKAENYEMILGSGSMIPGFEDGIIGQELEQPFEIKVHFPDNYGHKDLAGKEATFKIIVHEVREGKIPALDEEFAKKFNIQEGGVEALKKDIKENMVRELDRRLSSMNREKIFDVLMAENGFDLPNSLVDREIKELQHDMYHRLFGHEHHVNEKIPDFPRELFEAQAKKRVHLGLLFSEYVKQHEIAADQQRVEAMIDKFANAYEDPEMLKNWYKTNKERMGEVEALVLEEMVAEKVSAHAKLTEKQVSYEEIMNPKKDSEEKGE